MPIGVLDSGVGGLSVLVEIQKRLPHEHILYVADQANLPYGPRSLKEVQQFTEGITRFFISQEVKLVVVACNTASAAALYHLRAAFPEMPFVGMEPAIKPAARDTQTGIIGVIATAATFQGELYASLLDRFAHDITVITRPCPELVILAERGGPWTDDDVQGIKKLLAPIRNARADQLVLGCTHFSFLKPVLQAALPENVAIIDPAPAVARQTERVLSEKHLLADKSQKGKTVYYTSGSGENLRRQMNILLGEAERDVRELHWYSKELA